MATSRACSPCSKPAALVRACSVGTIARGTRRKSKSQIANSMRTGLSCRPYPGSAIQLTACGSKVDGVYDKGGKRDNRKEGEAIVARVPLALKPGRRAFV